ncbi:MAG TPA: sulfur carrier protein ThiS [Streptosporangiaceae bacterium]
MNVIINGTTRQVADGISLRDAVGLVTAAAAGVAAAVNDEVVRRAAWDSTVLADGDQIEILTAVQGG